MRQIYKIKGFTELLTTEFTTENEKKYRGLLKLKNNLAFMRQNSSFAFLLENPLVLCQIAFL